MTRDTQPLPDPSSGEALRARYGERYRWLLLIALMVGVMASIMSSTVSTWPSLACRTSSRWGRSARSG